MNALGLALLLAFTVQDPVEAPVEVGECGATSGLSALIDLGQGTYEGFEGGLYPGGSNELPPEHLRAALARAELVRPRDAIGAPDDERGLIGMLSLGMSGAVHLFGRFERDQDQNPRRNPRLVLVDGAQPGWSAEVMADPACPEWELVDQRLAAAGLAREQVQVVWLQQRRAPAYHRRMAALEAKLDDGRRGAGRTGRDPTPGSRPRRSDEEPGGDGEPDDDAGEQHQRSFPAHAELLRDELGDIARGLAARFPNLALCYVSDLPYGRYGKGDSSEPSTFELGFAVKWLIEQQLAGAPELEFDSARGPRRAPLLLWGPYLWADGAESNGQGTRWCRRDFEPDGIHPSPSGEVKLSELLGSFFELQASSAPWFTSRDGPALRVVEAAADAHVLSARREAAFGSDERLALGGGAPSAIAFVRFELPALERPVLQARLSLRNPTMSKVRFPELAVQRVELADWDERTLTFDGAPQLEWPPGERAVLLPEGSRDGSRTVDLTEHVNAHLGEALTLAIRSLGPEPGLTYLRSREGGDGPRLVLVEAP